MRLFDKKKISVKHIALLCILFLVPFVFSAPQSLKARMIADSEHGMKVMVLNYHMVKDQTISLAVPVQDFDDQMNYLKKHGYHTITPEELYESLSGNAELPENPVLITFDDGYVDNYENAYPILKKYGFKATIFAISSFVGNKKGYITWEEAREMEENGISIESHTVDHKSMTDLSDDQLRVELTESKKKLEKELGHPVNFMAYPTGTYNLHIAQMVKEAGYKGAFTIKYGNVDKGSNVYAMERVPIFQTENTYKSFLERIRYTPVFESFGWTKN